jgi:hypothetical protein
VQTPRWQHSGAGHFPHRQRHCRNVAGRIRLSFFR